MSNSYQITGEIIHIGEVETFPSGFCKRLVVVKTDAQYQNELPFELMKDKTSLVDGCAIGDTITAEINLNGREYNNKWYLSASAWKITTQADAYQAAETTQEPAPSDYFGMGEPAQEDQGEIPF